MARCVRSVVKLRRYDYTQPTPVKKILTDWLLRSARVHLATLRLRGGREYSQTYYLRSKAGRAQGEFLFASSLCRLAALKWR